MPIAYLSLGSNHEPNKNIPDLIKILRRRFPDLRVSNIYKYPDSKGESHTVYHNAAAMFQTELDAAQLIQILKAAETEVGRDRAQEIVAADIDLLLLGNQESSELKLPRLKDLREEHVYEPLLEIAPDVRLPNGQGLLDWLREEGLKPQSPAAPA